MSHESSGTESKHPAVRRRLVGWSVATALLVGVTLLAMATLELRQRPSSVFPDDSGGEPVPIAPPPLSVDAESGHPLGEPAGLDIVDAAFEAALLREWRGTWTDPFTCEPAHYRLLGGEWVVSLSTWGRLRFGRLSDDGTRDLQPPFPDRLPDRGVLSRRGRNPSDGTQRSRVSRPPVTKVIDLDDERESLIAFAVPERIGHPALTVRIPLDGSPAERADCRRVEVERLLELGRVDALAAEPEEGALRVHLVSPAGPTDAIIRLQPFHGHLRRVFVSPDGTRAAVVSEQFGSDAHLVRAFDTRTRERLWETTIESEPVSVAWRSDGSTWIVTSSGTWDVQTRVHVLDRRGERSIPVIEDVGLIHNHHNVIVPLLQCIVVGRRVHELPPVLAHLWPNGRACRSFFDTHSPGADRTSPATVRLDDQGLDYIRPKGERLFESKRYGFVPR